MFPLAFSSVHLQSKVFGSIFDFLMLHSLQQTLPEGNYKVLYVQTKPIRVKPLINAESQSDTFKVRHLFVLVDATTSIVILGIEILVYLTFFEDDLPLQHIFVAKCDTVGYQKSPVRVAGVIQCLIQWLENYDIRLYKIRWKKNYEKREESEAEREDSNEEVPSGSDEKVSSNTTFSLDSIKHSKDNSDTPDQKKNSAYSTYDITKKSSVTSIRKLCELLDDLTYYSQLPYYNDVPRKTTDTTVNLMNIPPKQIVRVCLFAKPALEYLFPASSRNKHKHLSGGAVLLRWWLRVLDTSLDEGWTCKLIIPGADDASTAKFLQPLKQKWSLGHIFSEGVAIRHVPLFPDDPKGRFLEHLVVEDRYQNMNNSRFFTELGIRQEFRLGDVVGLIGCEKVKLTDPKKQTSDPFYECNVLTLAEYKQLILVIKGANYSVEADITDLVELKIPAFFERNNMDGEYVDLVGKAKSEKLKNNEVKTVAVNTLQVKRKSEDIGHLVKRKQK